MLAVGFLLLTNPSNRYHNEQIADEFKTNHLLIRFTKVGEYIGPMHKYNNYYLFSTKTSVFGQVSFGMAGMVFVDTEIAVLDELIETIQAEVKTFSNKVYNTFIKNNTHPKVSTKKEL